MKKVADAVTQNSLSDRKTTDEGWCGVLGGDRGWDCVDLCILYEGKGVEIILNYFLGKTEVIFHEKHF